MSTYDELYKETEVIHRTLGEYRGRVNERKSALHDRGILAEFTMLEHTLIEWLYALEKRLQKIEGVVGESTGDEHVQDVQIPLSVNHLKR